MKKSAFFKKTLILTISNILTGTLSFIFSIILSREIGAKGVGLYQLAMPVYALFLFITGGGITISMSKIAAEKKALSKERELYKTVKALFVFELFWSIIITFFVILCASFISQSILHDKRTMLSILAFCPALIIVSLSSVYKGIYYGLQEVHIPATIDIFEKLIRIIIIFPLVSFCKTYGETYGAAAAVFSLSCGEIFSFLLFFICYKNYKAKHISTSSCDNSFQLVYNVIILAIPLALNGILATIFNMINTLLIPLRLEACNIPYETALALLGKLQGMALNIVFFPAIIIGAFNTILIPSISEAITFKKDHIVKHRIRIAYKISLTLGLLSMITLLALADKIGLFLYKDQSIGLIVRTIAPTVPFLYTLMITYAILNGLGKQKQLLINSSLAAILEVFLLYIFIGIPSLNIYGFGFSFFGTTIIGLALNLYSIKKENLFKVY